MWEKRIGSVIVVDKEGKMAGIITASDIIFAVTKSLVGRQVPVSGIMSKTSIMAIPNESVLTAVERMMKENVRHLPVIEKDGTPVGIISTKDAMGMSEPLLKFVFRSKNEDAATKKRPLPREPKLKPDWFPPNPALSSGSADLPELEARTMQEVRSSTRFLLKSFKGKIDELKADRRAGHPEAHALRRGPQGPPARPAGGSSARTRCGTSPSTGPARSTSTSTCSSSTSALLATPGR